MFKTAVQRGRSERKGEAYFRVYGEPLGDARTKLAAIFNILLESWWMVQTSLCIAELASEPNP